MNLSIDLDAYVSRIGYDGPRTATVEALAALHRRHPAAIPFENLDPLLRRPVRLDAASLQQKLVHDRRGGYCYEHNLLFAGVLRAFGFDVHGLAARVMWNAPGDALRPRSHMLLRIDVGGAAYVADVGFGGLTLTKPLRLEMNVEQPTPHEVFRLVAAGGDVVMEARVRGGWKPLYRFGPEEHFGPDYEMANWYTSTHPSSPFVSRLMVARALDGKRQTLLDTAFTTHDLQGRTERRTLATVTDLAHVLETAFGIALPRGRDLDSALERIITTPAPTESPASQLR
jgi:N-hydroxyarylamine O-acetyltransferase